MEYIIPDFLREYKMLYLAVFGLYLSIAYWVLIFCRDQIFYLVRDAIETVVVSLGQLFIRSFDLLAYLIKTPFSLIDFLITERSKSFKERKDLLLIWSQTCLVDELRWHIEEKLEEVDSVSDLTKLEASIRPFWDNWLFTYGNQSDETSEPVGSEYALDSEDESVKANTSSSQLIIPSIVS